MAFYSYMMNKYSKASKSQKLTKEERMINAKAKIEHNLKESIVGHIQFANSMNHNFTYEDAITIHNIAGKLRSELEQMQPLTAEEYFAQLANKEQHELYSYISECQQDIDDVNAKVEKIENNEGLSSKFYNFTGLSGAKVAQYNEQIDASQTKIDTAKESFVEWFNMPDQQVDYVLARYEQEGTTSLDVRHLNNYAMHQHAQEASQTDDACQQ